MNFKSQSYDPHFKKSNEEISKEIILEELNSFRIGAYDFINQKPFSFIADLKDRIVKMSESIEFKKYLLNQVIEAEKYLIYQQFYILKSEDISVSIENRNNETGLSFKDVSGKEFLYFPSLKEFKLFNLIDENKTEYDIKNFLLYKRYYRKDFT